MIIAGNTLLGLTALACMSTIIMYGLSAFKDERFHKYAAQLFKVFAILVILLSLFFLMQILNHNFEIEYVYAYSSVSLDFFLLLSTFWAGQVGTFVLWLFFTVIVGMFLMRVKWEHKDKMIFFFLLTAVFLIVLMLVKSPFKPLNTEVMGIPPEHLPLQDGRGLNPLLQNFWMIIHPPIIFLGYVLIAVPFAFALAALSANKFSDWAKKSFPWSLLSLAILGLGIFLGGYWAYETLGWGGYWAWDPVENSSLIPWLINLALVHGLLMERRGGAFRKTNLALALISFLLIIYGTFLTRSGILEEFSVHSFTEPGKVLYWIMIVFMAGFAVLSAVLFVRGMSALKKKASESGSQPWYETLMILAALFAILLAILTWVGTSWPVITTILGNPAAVTQTFYNTVALPIAIIMAVLTAIASLYIYITRGKNYFVTRIIIVAVCALTGTIVAVIMGVHIARHIALIYASIFAIIANLIALAAMPNKRISNFGGNLSHVGFGIILIGFLASTVFAQSSGVIKLRGNENTELLGINCRFLGLGDNFLSSDNRAEIEVTSGSGEYMARPAFYQDPYSGQTVINPHIHRTLLYDTYYSPQQYFPEYTTLTLAQGDSNRAFGLDIKFIDYKMDSHDESGASRVGASLDVTVGDSVYTVIPYFLANTGRGGGEAYARIPDSDYKIYLDRILADDKMIIKKIIL
jgi:cytochrome c-type biogenesis protein CcmF